MLPMEQQQPPVTRGFEARDIQEFAAMHALVSNMEVNSKRTFYRIMREPTVTSNTLIPAMGMTLGLISTHMQTTDMNAVRLFEADVLAAAANMLGLDVSEVFVAPCGTRAFTVNLTTADVIPPQANFTRMLENCERLAQKHSVSAVFKGFRTRRCKKLAL